jgi:hypothetical protein
MTTDNFVQEMGDRGIRPSGLPAGTRLLVSTANSLYEFRLSGMFKAEVFGGTRSDGTVRFARPTPVTINGATFGGTAIRPDWIGAGMRMELGAGDGVVTTSPVRRVIVEAAAGEWAYTLDW